MSEVGLQLDKEPIDNLLHDRHVPLGHVSRLNVLSHTIQGVC